MLFFRELRGSSITKIKEELQILSKDIIEKDKYLLRLR
jgi:hypothetical protein